MPWKETSPVEQRKEWIDAYMAHEPASARRGGGFGISRKTGYRCIAHFLGDCALLDRSRRPTRSPRAVATAIEDALVSALRKRPIGTQVIGHLTRKRTTLLFTSGVH